MTVEGIDYHERQHAAPYRSTVLFCDWLASIGFLTDGQSILDLACGMGANIAYMGARYPFSDFVGVDYNRDLVRRGNRILSEKQIKNADIVSGDLYALPYRFITVFDGIVSYQVLSWQPEPYAALRAMARLNPKWIAATSLFYDGPVNCTIEVKEPHREQFYNIYSIPDIRDSLFANGYTDFHYTPFRIDIDLPKPTHGGMQTYTDRGFQISGPLIMPWYFIAASKEDNGTKEQAVTPRNDQRM